MQKKIYLSTNRIRKQDVGDICNIFYTTFIAFLFLPKHLLKNHSQVAQTVVSKVVTSPLGTSTSSSSLDPNTLLDALVEHIKEGLTSK